MEITRISALAELASGIAHELNQPLGAVVTYAQAGERMLNRPQPLISQAIEVLRQVNQEALGAGERIRYIRRLFDQSELARVRCHMPDLVMELHSILEILTRRIGCELQVEVAAGLPAVNADRLRIQYVLLVLVQNACDASTQAPGARKVAVAVNSNRYEVETSITDSGPGVISGRQDQLFRPFYTTKPHGTGLGLASSRAIIEAHEGSLGYENMPSGGSRFWFRLPLGTP